MQDIIVTLLALVAAGVIFRRVVGFVGVRAEKPKCASCGSTTSTCTPASPSNQTSGTHPLALIRPSSASAARASTRT